jgi:peptidoglycan/LPS O-acetylase OafA/YrhL
MKKSYALIILSVLVLLSSGIWIYSDRISNHFNQMLLFAIILVIVGFALFIGFSRLKSERRGEPAEDELSKKTLQKASSLSYYISIYMWLAVSYYSDKTTLHTHTLIGFGILGMAIIFFASWLYFKLKGIKDA